MTDTAKIKPTHIQRAAVVYVRQSTTSQVEHHRESTARQYALAERAQQLGWTNEQVILIDEEELENRAEGSGLTLLTFEKSNKPGASSFQSIARAIRWRSLPRMSLR